MDPKPSFSPIRPALALLAALTMPVWAADAPPKAATNDAAPSEQAAPAKAFLGIGMDKVDEALNYHLKLENDIGILVAEVTPGSTAEKMGLKQYDVIVACDGVPIYTTRAFAKHIGGRKVGDLVKVDVRRGADTVTLTGTLQARPAELDQEEAGPGPGPWMGPQGFPNQGPHHWRPARPGAGQREGKVQKPDGSVMEWSIEDEEKAGKDEKPAKK